MQRVDAKLAPDSQLPASTAARTLVPDPHGHAVLLIRTYGVERALHIAQANRSITRSDDYWGEVFLAVQALEKDGDSPAADLDALGD